VHHYNPTSGRVTIFDATTLESINVVEAHQSPLSSCAINNEGTLLATASEKGTIIRIFTVPEGEKLFEFRRGTIPAKMFSMSFNATSTLLCASSETETVHIFKLSKDQPEKPGSSDSPKASTDSRDRSVSPSTGEYDDRSEMQASQPERPAPSTFAGMIRRTSQNVGMSLATRAAGYLPKQMTAMWEPLRDFAWVKVPKANAGSPQPIRTVVALSSTHPQLMVATSEGMLCIYNIDLEKGGEGVLESQHA